MNDQDNFDNMDGEALGASERDLSDKNLFESRLDIAPLSDAIAKLRTEIKKIIVGQHEMIDLLMVCLLSEGHALIEGVPGVAKTLTAKLIAKTIATDFSRIQFTPDLMPSDIIGTSIFNFKTSEFSFKKGPIFSNIILIDEINRAPAKTQSALFEVMEERQITFDGEKYQFSYPFMVLATQNPIEQEGTYRLPEAQLDRFFMKIKVSYPTEMEEVQILEQMHLGRNKNLLSEINAVIDPAELEKYRSIIQSVKVEEKLIKYIASIVSNTRKNKDLYLGASPRASIALLAASKSYAVMQKRDFVTPDDIQYIAKPVLRHRIILSPEREMEGFTPDNVIERILAQVEVPR